ncbi:tetratricopeptide repeat protein [Streptomyces sp. NPDC048106]|uniref:tetratricopeptide repeat protein n=1 Tax=Streptomyces sp. NPDC048106 TaxID=3155750 RepID=UPI003453C139
MDVPTGRGGPSSGPRAVCWGGCRPRPGTNCSHWGPTLDAQADVALALGALGDHEAARVLDTELVRRIERAVGKNHAAAKAARAALARDLRALGREREADEVQGIRRFAF